MTQMPTVSVILTSFNHEKYTREAIDSVLNQTFTDFELIIWDDASKDDSWAVINSYSDQRIKAFRNEITKRGIYGINKSIAEVATGEYIAIHHSDDVWELDKLEKQVAFLDANPETGAVFTWAQLIDENGVESENSWFQQENKTQWQWLQLLFNECNQLCHPSVLIRKHCYEEVGVYRYGLGQTGDAEMWSRVLIKFPIHVIPENLTKHRKFSDMSNTSGDRIEVQIRTGNEWNLLRENYLAISSFEDIVATFPSLERFRTPEGFDNKFLLGMACLYECKQRSAWQLGLKWLFDLLNDKASHKKIRELYSFSYMDFIKLTSKFDVYFIEGDRLLAEQNGQMFSLNQAVADRDGQIASLKAVVDCNGQLASLNQAVYERDVQLASLKQSVADRESRIAILQQSLLECESGINNLKRSLIEKEKKIDELHHFVELTNSLGEKLRYSELKITEIFASTSWKASEPLRALSRLFRKLKIASIVPLEVGGAAQQIAERESSLIASGFDAEFYRKAYPDLCGCDLFAHYSEYGKNEGRLPCVPDLITNYDLKNLDGSKETVLIVSHEASRTGAPILALNIAQHLKEKYNVIAFLLGGGCLLADFQECCDIVVEPFPQAHNPFITSVVLTKLISQVDLKFAIVNSIVSKPVLLPLASHFVPSLCLVHEFASYTYPKNTIREVLLWASQVVFSARIVYENNAAQCVELKGSCPAILPQGKCQVPYSKDKVRLDENQSQRIRKMFRPDSLPDNTVVILGAGFVQIRKGVDLFLACAARVVGLHPKNTFRFVWVGHGFEPDLDIGYSVYLQDQISRSGLEDHVCFTGEMSDIDMAYELSDVLFLSSRLDPLPNVAIDAMFKQLPVICFDNTTGIADLLKENGLGEACVIPYLDIEQAAQRLVALIENSDQRKRLGKEIKEVGEKLFNMRSYVDSLERQVLDCVVMQQTEKRDCTLIENDGALNLDFYLPPSWPALSSKEAVRAFVRSWKSHIDMRKPFPGFHPGIYEDCHGLSQTGKNNPLAAFIQAGKPEGPWLCDLILPSSPVQKRNKLPFRVALHIHVFFVDLFLDILRRLDGQEFLLDLLISTPSLEVAEEVSSMVSGYTNGTVDIRTVPNRGRDIGPLLTEFSETILKNYDVIGHVHTKKSGDVKDAALGQIWLNFLLENLIGKRYPMALTILERMAGDKKLGLVFPEDPWVVGWSGNKKIAEDLAHQCGIKELPDQHFNFPIGTMFWARTEALKPLLTKGFRWEDFPDEPLPYDGTVLHAIERLLPFVAKKMGYHVSMTHVPGVTR